MQRKNKSKRIHLKRPFVVTQRNIFRFSIFITAVLMLFFAHLPAYGNAKNSPPAFLKDINVEQPYSENQMSSSVVRCIIQDQKGFLWLGTQAGLYRYDGYKYKTFKQRIPGEETSAYYDITCLYEGSDGGIWNGTVGNGLYYYDWRTESFTHYNHDTADLNSLSRNCVTAVLEDSRGFIWVGTDIGGLNRLDKKKGQFEHFKHNPENPGSISSNKIISLCEDKSGTLWIGTENGLNEYNAKTRLFKSYKHDPKDPGSISNNEILSVYEDGEGILWVGTKKGLNKFERGYRWFVRYNHNPTDPTGPSNDIIGAIIEDNKGRLWLGTGTSTFVGSGITILDKKTMTFYRYQNNGPQSYLINHASILSLHKDRNGVVWFGVYGAGIFKYDFQKSDYQFNHYKHEETNPDSISRSEVWSVWEDRESNLWVGTLHEGLNFIHKQTGKVTHYRTNTNRSNGLLDDSVRALFEDATGDIWIGTPKGLSRLHRKTDRFTHYHNTPHVPTSIPPYSVSAITEDNNRNIWVSTWGGGLARLNRKTGVFTQLKHTDTPNTIRNDFIVSMYKDRSGFLWLATRNDGLSKVNLKTEAFTEYRQDDKETNCINNNCVMAIYEDSKGIIWIGTWGGGLNRLDPKTGRFSHYTTRNGLANATIYGVLGDADDNIWVSTHEGISKFDPNKQVFSNYTQAHGLLDQEYNQAAFHKGRSGILYFGGINGLNYFQPKTIAINPRVPPIVITEFKIFGQPVKANPDGRYRYITPNQAQIRLDHNENHISFEFASLEYTAPQFNQYAYMMEGADEKWIYCGNRRTINYADLEGGEYTLKIKGSNNTGVWNETGISIFIEITLPFWETWWFRLICLIIIGIHVALIFYFRTKKLKQKINQDKIIQDQLKQSKLELEQAKDVIECSHSEILMLISSISSILIALDSEEEIRQWNVPAEDFFGISNADSVGKKFKDVFSQCIDSSTLDQIVRIGFDPLSSVEEKEIEVYLGGRTFLLQVLINPIMDKNGNKRGVMLLCEDISSQKAEENKNNLLLKLKNVGEMYAGIMHEINTPLQYISINNKIISDAQTAIDSFQKQLNEKIKQSIGENAGDKDPELQRWLEANNLDNSLARISGATDLIKDGVNRVMGVSKTMKEFFHPGRETMEMCNINELIKSTILVSKYDLKKSADIKTKLASQQLLTFCYPAELNLVFINLMINAADAVKETGKRGEIIISTLQENREITIEISDTGIGIPDEIKEKVYDQFYTTKGVGKGTGQGLALARRIICNKHQGKLYFKSKPGKGTTFFIHLPIRDSQ